MNYYEVNFTYHPIINKEIVEDVLAAELGEIGFETFSSTSQGLSAYIPAKKFDEEKIKSQLLSFPLQDVTFNFESHYIKGENWNEEWEKNYFQPITIGNECIIHASFHNIEDTYKYSIVIDPKMAFGTGNHETTWLMIQEILPLDLQDKKVLDMGCGTAVLGILAALKGAEKVVAIDIDEWAYENALENVKLNDASSVEILLGGAEKIPGDTLFDVVLANINRNILLCDIHRYVSAMKTGGILFMSGFYKEDIPVIEKECIKHGLTLLSYAEKNNWVAVKVSK